MNQLKICLFNFLALADAYFWAYLKHRPKQNIYFFMAYRLSSTPASFKSSNP